MPDQELMVRTALNVVLKDWEVLGPFPVSKMEIDGDPTFQNLKFHEFSNMGIDAISSQLTCTCLSCCASHADAFKVTEESTVVLAAPVPPLIKLDDKHYK